MERLTRAVLDVTLGAVRFLFGKLFGSILGLGDVWGVVIRGFFLPSS